MAASRSTQRRNWDEVGIHPAQGQPRTPPVMVPPTLDAIVRRLAGQPEVARVVLFGSRARGDFGAAV